MFVVITYPSPCGEWSVMFTQECSSFPFVTSLTTCKRSYWAILSAVKGPVCNLVTIKTNSILKQCIFGTVSSCTTCAQLYSTIKDINFFHDFELRLSSSSSPLLSRVQNDRSSHEETYSCEWWGETIRSLCIHDDTLWYRLSVLRNSGRKRGDGAMNADAWSRYL